MLVPVANASVARMLEIEARWAGENGSREMTIRDTDMLLKDEERVASCHGYL